VTALVELHRDPIPAGAVHVRRLPPWLPPSAHSNATYWHRPRSAYMRSDASRYEFVRGGFTKEPAARFVLLLWCGQGRFLDQVDDLAFDPPAELRCGTCEGRATGYAEADGLVFRPRDPWGLPTYCPGSEYDPDGRTCSACGRRVNGARGWWTSGMAQHRPDPALADRHRPCGRHGWLKMHARYDGSGALVCGDFRCPHVSDGR
jgi:hypothetical protein